MGVARSSCATAFAGPHTWRRPSTRAGQRQLPGQYPRPGGRAQPGRAASGIRTFPRFVGVGGGVAIQAGGSLLGAVGVSGARAHGRRRGRRPGSRRSARPSSSDEAPSSSTCWPSRPPGGWRSTPASLGPAGGGGFYDRPDSATCTSSTSRTAAAAPAVYFREPSVNSGIGPASGRPLTSSAAPSWPAYGNRGRAREAHALTTWTSSPRAHLRHRRRLRPPGPLVTRLRAGRPGALLLDGGRHLAGLGAVHLDARPGHGGTPAGGSAWTS